jgi:RimJ/RimL family protein N-acetyltransferase
MTGNGAIVSRAAGGPDEQVPRSLDGLTVREVRAADTSALSDLFERLSPRSRRHRFLGPKKTLSPRELENLTDLDHVQRQALAVVAPDGRFVAVARYGPVPGEPQAAEVALTVADEWQDRGIGSTLAQLLIAEARLHRITRLRAMTLADNHGARSLMRHLGFALSSVEADVMVLELHLGG